MGELWRNVSELMWKRPSVWLPVVLADLLGFFVNMGRLAMLRGMIMRRVEFHSALGGPPMRTPMTAAAVHSANTLVIVIDWSTYFVRLLLYTAALIATAALVRGFRERLKQPATEILPSLRRYAGGIVSLGLRALAIYGGVALVYGWIGSSMLARGHKAWLASGWPETAATLALMLVLASLLAPVAVQVLARRLAPPALKQRAQVFAFTLGLVALALGAFVSANVHALRGGPSFGRSVLELTGSWIVAVPYAVLFTGLSLLAQQVPRDPEAATDGES